MKKIIIAIFIGCFLFNVGCVEKLSEYHDKAKVVKEKVDFVIEVADEVKKRKQETDTGESTDTHND